uniref:Taste receptor type 2 n=1 Tax=Panagrolaimus sp. PS1159 TaxID=55785 RepID=A0AC35GFL7_9BILA
MLGFFVSFIPLYIFLMIKVLPKVMMTYRYLMTSCGCTATALTILRALWIPIPTAPVMGVYSAGIIGKFGPTANLICLNLYFTLLVKMQLCVVCCLIYQFSALRPFSWISHLGNCPTRVLKCYAAYFIGMSIILSTFIYTSIVDRVQFFEYANRTNNFYVMEIIKNEPTWIGFSSALKPAVIGLGIFATVPDLCVALLAIFLTIKLWFIIEADKSIVSTLTQKLERNLYHTFIFRTTVLILFYTLPYMGIAISILFEIQSSKLGIICHSSIILQGAICLIGTILMIKHFRVYIFGCCFNEKVHDSSSPSNSNGIPTTLTARSETFPSSPSKLPPLNLKNVMK